MDVSFVRCYPRQGCQCSKEYPERRDKATNSFKLSKPMVRQDMPEPNALGECVRPVCVSNGAEAVLVELGTVSELFGEPPAFRHGEDVRVHIPEPICKGMSAILPR